ncbi:hypothetical protein PM082_015683 [Marasmius tenuissimus]|nr:hypothetical protein PM082_015683 [Marasmius tenuissimus]
MDNTAISPATTPVPSSRIIDSFQPSTTAAWVTSRTTSIASSFGSATVVDSSDYPVEEKDSSRTKMSPFMPYPLDLEFEVTSETTLTRPAADEDR